MVIIKRIPMEQRINQKALRASQMANSPYKLPVILLLDTSGSMKHNDNIGKLNDGVEKLYKHFNTDEYASLYTELMVVTFGDGDAQIQADFGDPRKHTIQRFEPKGNSPFCTGMLMALDLIEDQIDIYNDKGIVTHPPVVVTLTDGVPTKLTNNQGGAVEILTEAHEEYKKVKERFNEYVKELSLDSHIIYLGDKNDNTGILKHFASNEENIREITNLDFDTFFNNLGNSISALSRVIPTGHSQFAMQNIFEPFTKK